MRGRVGKRSPYIVIASAATRSHYIVIASGATRSHVPDCRVGLTPSSQRRLYRLVPKFPLGNALSLEFLLPLAAHHLSAPRFAAVAAKLNFATYWVPKSEFGNQPLGVRLPRRACACESYTISGTLLARRLRRVLTRCQPAAYAKHLLWRNLHRLTTKPDEIFGLKRSECLFIAQIVCFWLLRSGHADQAAIHRENCTGSPCRPCLE